MGKKPSLVFSVPYEGNSGEVAGRIGDPPWIWML